MLKKAKKNLFFYICLAIMFKKTYLFMKKITLLFTLLMLFSGTALMAQSQRLVLAEEFTNASCGPCAGQNPDFDALLQANADKITSIKYHMSWPGTDPMYSHNTVDNNARRMLYGINSVPHVQMDGSWWDGMPMNVTQSRINAAYAIPSPFEILVKHELSDDEQTIHVTALVKATADVSSDNLRLFLVVIEKHIHFNSPPGYNGEKDFYNVMKKILPDKNGYLLSSDISTGQYFIVESSWELANVYNKNELSVVAFIQDMNTKEIFQAANSSTDDIVLPFANDVEITGIKYATQKNCSGTMSPVITIRNNGSSPVSSVEVHYHINNGEEGSMQWTGSLSSLQKTELALNDLSFPVEDTNHLVVSVTAVNGSDDQYEANNTLLYEFYKADVVEQAYLIIYLDDHPEETSWKLKNSAGNVVQEGGPYPGQSGQKIFALEFNGSDCYKLEMNDAGGDGFTGSGFYLVAFGNNSISFQGGAFTDKDVNEIGYDIVGVEDHVDRIDQFKVFPNPADNRLNVTFGLKKGGDVEITLLSMEGKVVEHSVKDYSAGEVTLQVDVSSLKRGLYLLKVRAGDALKVSKVSIR
jgi:hypothetical protein